MAEVKIGVELGGIFFRNIENGDDITLFNDDYREAHVSPDTWKGLWQFVYEFGPQNVHIIAKCTPAMEVRIANWLLNNHFHTTTHIWPGNIHYVRKQREKTRLAEKFDLTHFVDSRMEPLVEMPMVSTRVLFKAKQRDLADYHEVVTRVHRVESWPELGRLILFF